MMAINHRRPLGLLAGLSLLAGLGLGSCSRPLPPEAIPPRILYFEPSTTDTLVLDEQGAERFVLHAQAGAEAEYWLNFAGGDQLLPDNSFTFTPADYGLSWPAIRQDSLVTVTMELRDAGATLSRSWPVRVSVTPGVEFITEPNELELNAAVNDTLPFRMQVLNAGATVEYRWRVNGSHVGDGETFDYVPQDEGEVLIQGHAWVPGTTIDLNHYWQVIVEPCGDQDAPGTVSDLRIGPGPAPGELVVRFASASDGPTGELARYEIRFWDAALPAEQWSTTNLIGLLPVSEGVSEELFTIGGLAPGRYFYVRVRAQDACGNLSPWSDLSSGKVAGYAVGGRVRDLETGQGIPDLEVRYGIGRAQDEVLVHTDGSGAFHCRDVPAKEANPSNPPGRIRDESLVEVGAWYDIVEARAINDSLYYEFGTFHGGPTETGVYPEFLSYFRFMLKTDVWAGDVLHMAYPIAVHLQAFSYNGVDYQALARNAVAIWEEDTGLDLFTEVASADEAALTIQYYPGEPGSGWYEILARAEGTEVPTLARIHWMAGGQPGSEPGLQRVILHELGHALGPFRHSSEIGHVMATTNLQDRPSVDEVKMMRILYHMAPREALGHLSEN